MRVPDTIIVRGSGGWQGTMETSLLLGGSEPRVLVRLGDGAHVLVPTGRLALQEDGSYFTALGTEELEQAVALDGGARKSGSFALASGRVLIYEVERFGADDRRLSVRAVSGESGRCVRGFRSKDNIEHIALRKELQIQNRRHSVTRTVVALYDEFRAAESAVRDLAESGFRRDDIGLVFKDPNGERRAGVKAGNAGHPDAALDGLTGLLTGVDSLTIPGVGAIVAAGPLIAALAGAGMGTVEGGLAGALVDGGVPPADAQLFAEGVRRGLTLVLVRARDQQAAKAKDIMTGDGAVDVQGRAVEWRQSGWHESPLDRAPQQEPSEAPTYGTSPMQIDEQIGPERAGSAYGGAEYRNVERAGTEYVEDQDLAAQTADSGPNASTGEMREAGVGYSSGAGQAGEGYQGGPATQEERRLTGARDSERLGADFRRHYDTVYAGNGDEYERYQPAYRFGYDLVQDQRFQNRRWSEIEPEAQRLWDGTHPSNGWDRVREAVRFGWERGMAEDQDRGTAGRGPGNETGTGLAGPADQAARRNRPSYQGPEEKRI